MNEKRARARASGVGHGRWHEAALRVVLAVVIALGVSLTVVAGPSTAAPTPSVAPSPESVTPAPAKPLEPAPAPEAPSPEAAAPTPVPTVAGGPWAGHPHLLPGLLLGLLLGLAALHLARQIYIDAPGSLAASALLVMAFLFEYVAFGLHVPVIGTGNMSALLQALSAAGLAVVALFFISGFLELPQMGGSALWGTWGLIAFAGFAALLGPFNANLASHVAHVALALAAVWATGLGMALGRRGDTRAGYLVPGLLLIVAALVVGAIVVLDGNAASPQAPLGHALFVIGLLLVAFAVESIEVPPERSYLALPGPAANGEAAEEGMQPAAAAPASAPPLPVRPATDLMLARISERRLALALAAARHGLWDWNILQSRIALSPETEALLGLDPGTFDGSEDAWLERIADDDRERFRHDMAALVGEGEATFEFTFKIVTPNGEIRHARLDGACINPGADGRATRCIGLVAPMADRPIVLEAPAPAAVAASVPTIAVGRSGLIEALDRRLAAEGRPETGCWLLLLIDLDRFHSINDSFGHAVGDQVIEVLVGRLTAGLTGEETLMRLGGDEFALLLHDGLGKPPRGVRADRLISLIGRPIPLDDGREVFVSASLGLVALDHTVTSGAAALKDCEAALYHVKRRGGGRYALFTPEMREQVRVSASLESELRRALEREEIVLHYQPIMALADGRVSGFEALIRWRHAEHGILTADAFVDVAEKSGLIIPLGKYALTMASVQLFQWQTFFPLERPLFVCVNVSSRQLAGHDLVADVRDVLSSVQLAPQSLRLEVNEQLVAQDAAHARVTLEEIKALGAGIALDDFGTGYASMGVLEELPFDTIKVDKSLIARLREQSETEKPVVVRTIVDLAHDLDMDVIAEGVESETDVRRLRALGCEFGQGYFFGSPMPPEDVQAFIAQHWAN